MPLQTMTRQQIAELLAPSPRLLTDREFRLLAMVAAGCTIDAAAATVHISRSTAKSVLATVRRKLGGARSNAHAVALAYERGILGGHNG